MKIISLALLISIQLLILAPAKAETIESLTLKMGQKLGNYKLLDEAIVRGGLRVRLCQYCHGKDGNSVKGDIPNLAAQNPVYLLTQFEHFRNGKRRNRVMNELAKGLSSDERINIALYYASQDVKKSAELVNTKSAVYVRGAKLYQSVCINCHGAKGHGQQSLPRIAGQKYQFMMKTLSAYKNKNGVRPDSPMIGISAQLSAKDIEAIATFVNAMK